MAGTGSTTQRIHRMTALILLLAAGSQAARACTLYAAHGTRVAGGGMLMVKVRDWTPMDRQSLAVVRPSRGHAYFALTTEGEDPGVKAGINEKGLVVESATAGSIPKEDRQEADRTMGLLRKLLTDCATVDEVLAKRAILRGPRYLFVGDATQVARIEIGPKGSLRIDVTKNGVACHTNHYLPGVLETANQKEPGPSSLSRLARIEALLNTRPTHTLDGFLGFSRDQHAGPDLSIFRTGLKPKGTRTMSVWAVHLKPGGGGEVVVRMLHEGEPEVVVQRDFAELFAMKPSAVPLLPAPSGTPRSPASSPRSPGRP